ncbi:hypothetical protein MMPV_009610, partial [Pyropia vietnamensis]
MARLRKLIPQVVQALQRTQQRYKRNFDARVRASNKTIKSGDLVYTTAHVRSHKLANKAVGPFRVIANDHATFVIDVEGEHVRISTDHVVAAPTPDRDDETQDHPTPPALLTGKVNTTAKPSGDEEYLVDKLV